MVRRSSKQIGAFYQGGNRFVPGIELWSQRWTGRLRVTETGIYRFGISSVGRARVMVNGVLVADNWTDPQPGQTFFDRGSEEVVGTIELSAAAESAEVVVEWSSGGRPPGRAALRRPALG